MKEKHIYILIALICILPLIYNNSSGSVPHSSDNTTGVPESIVLSSDPYLDFANDYGAFEYEIFHNYDNATHIDNVTLNLICEEECAFLIYNVNLFYEYYKSDDIWTLVDVEEPARPTLRLKVDELTNFSPWEGKNSFSSNAPGFSYSIYIDDIDTSEKTLTMRYEIDFADNKKYSDVMITDSQTISYMQIANDWFYTFNFIPEGSGYDYNLRFQINTSGITHY